MATAQGVRFAALRLPTPGSGLDDQDRYAIGGVVLPANSISLPEIGPDADFRFSVCRIPTPGDGLDVSDRRTLAGVVSPLDHTAHEFGISKRFYLAGCYKQPDGVFRDQDRQAIAGVYPTGAESQLFIEIFDTSWIIRPTWIVTELPGPTDGSLSAAMNAFSSSWVGSVLDPPLDTIEHPIRRLIIGVESDNTFVQLETRKTAGVVVSQVTSIANARHSTVISMSSKHSAISIATHRIEVT